jgi:hypothetical protein
MDEYEQKRAIARAHFEDLMRRNPERLSAAARGRFADDDDLARREFEVWQAAEAERAAKADAQKAKAERKPAQATDWAAHEGWLDEKMAGFVEESVGPAIEEIANMIAAELDKESAARSKLEDRLRELELKSGQLEVAIGKRDVTIARQDLAIAELERRLATGDRRTGAIDAMPSMKTIN